MTTFQEWFEANYDSQTKHIVISEFLQSITQEELIIANLAKVEIIEGKAGGNSAVKKIIIRDCPKLEKIGLSNSLELRTVEVINCPQLACFLLEFAPIQIIRQTDCPRFKELTTRYCQGVDLDLSSLDLSVLEVQDCYLLKKLPRFGRTDQIKWLSFTNSKQMAGELNLSDFPQLQYLDLEKTQVKIVSPQSAELQELRNKLNQLENQLLPFADEDDPALKIKDQEIEQKQIQIQSLEDKVESLIKNSANYVASDSQKNAEINQLKEKIQTLQVEKLQLEQEREALLDDYQKEKQKLLEKWEKEREQLTKEINKFLQESKKLKDENQNLKKNNEQLEDTQQQLEEKIEELNEQLKQIKTQLQEAQKERTVVENSLKELKKLLQGKVDPKYIEQIIKNSQEYEKVIQELANKNQQKQQDLKRLKEQAQLLEQAKDKVQKLEQEKKGLEKELVEAKSQKPALNQEDTRQTVNFFAWWNKHKQFIYTIGGGIIGLLGLAIIYRSIKEAGK